MDIKARICIPTYNNKTSIMDVVNGCLSKTDLPIIIIDDGSDYDVQLFLKDMLSGRVEIIRHLQNMGKGKALQTAFTNSILKGFTHLVTIDADGQHPPAEITRVLLEAKKHPWDLIIGKRIFSDADNNIPGISRFGRNFSNYWVKYQTDYAISDSQSGFRCYPLFHVQNMNFYTKKFDFEIEILIRLLWKGVRVTEVSIETIYPSKDTRVSHFNKFWDNARISFLNVVLVCLTIFRRGLSAKEISWAAGVGAFIGCTPLWGLHAIIALLVSIVFRLNFIVLLIGTQISIPPVVPFLVLASLFCGKYITGEHTSFLTYVSGTLVVGTSIGLIVGSITYVISQKLSHKNTWTGKSRGGKFGNWFLIQVLKVFGLKAGYFCLFFIAPYFYFFAPKAKKASIEYWKNVKPLYGPLKIRLMVLRHFYRFGTLLLDKQYQKLYSHLVFNHEEKGLLNITQSIQKKTPLILVGAHVGAWEMAIARLADHNVLNKIKTVQFEFDQNDRTEHQILVNQMENPIFDIREQLTQGKLVGMLADRPINTSYTLIPFFNKLFCFDTTAFRIAAATNAELAFFFSFKKKDNKYEFICTKPKHYNYDTATDKNEKLDLWLKEFSATLEGLLKEYPDQWLNFYPAWSCEPMLLKPHNSNKISTAS